VEGSVTKRKDGRWQGVVDVPNITGKRQRKYVYAPTRAACRQKVYEVIVQIESRSLLDVSKVTFNDYAQKWLKTYCEGLSPTTQEGYRKSVKYANKYIGDAILVKILPVHIQEMVNSFSKTHSEKTCKNLIGDIRGVFNYAIVNKMINANPCVGIKVKSKKGKYKYNIYTVEQFNSLLDSVTDTSLELPVILAGLCGMRLSEIMGLMWGDIDFEECTVDIRRAMVFVGKEVIEKDTKTNNSYRKIDVPYYVIERLKQYRGIGYVYPKKDGSPEHGGNYRLRLYNFMKKKGLPKTRFHDLRHFAATTLLDMNVPDKVIASMLGHANTNMTKKYQHVIGTMEKRAAVAMNSIVENRNKNMDVKMDVKQLGTQ
jgi:integrase